MSDPIVLAGFAVTLIVQTGGFAFAFGRVSGKVDEGEKIVNELKGSLEKERKEREEAVLAERMEREKADKELEHTFASVMSEIRKEAKEAATNANSHQDRRLNAVEERIEKLETDLTEQLHKGFEKMEGVISGLTHKVSEQAMLMQRLELTQSRMSQTHMQAMRDSGHRLDPRKEPG